MPCIITGLSPFSSTQGRALASSKSSSSQKHLLLLHPPPRILLLLHASLLYQRVSPRFSSNSSTSFLRSIMTSSVRAMKTWAILLCWSMGLRHMGLLSRQPYRRQNPAVRREEMTQVQQMLSSNVIRLSNSPWASPVVMVRKKDGSLHFCVDFRQLNAATVKDAHPLPRIDDLLDALHGAKWFSTLDLKSGYWQVPIAEQDKEKTAFRTSSGQLFEFNQVPFGLCNAPATFSRLMDRVLAGLHWETCLFYLDDIIVFSSTWEEHLARLREVFER